MAHIVTPENRSLYIRELDDMFRMRYRIAVGELGWDIPGIEVGYDKDQFDTEETTYILELSEDRKVQGCTRLNPTTSPHMLTEVFKHYCDLQPIPQSPQVYECSRYFIDRTVCETKERRTDVRQGLGLAITEYLMSIGATHMTWLTHQALYQHTISIYDSEPLGLPREEKSDEAIYIAAISRIDEKTWARQRANLERDLGNITYQAVPITPSGISPARRNEAA